MKEALFITGGLGMVGRKLVSLFLSETDFDIYLLVHEQGKTLQREEIIRTFFQRKPSEEFLNRIHLIGGDFTKPGLGMTSPEIRTKITHIIHAGASTRFDLPLPEARIANVTGTKQVLDFAAKCPRLEQFGFISTVYVSGKRVGKIKEKDRVHASGFVNSYEQSEYEAEGLIEEASKVTPAAIYRLSTIIGDSTTGEVSHFTAPHQAIRIIYLGLAAMLPGTADYVVDLISSNYAAETIFQLFFKHFEPGQTYHVVSGTKKSYRLQELIDATHSYLSEFDPDWKKRNYPKPVIATEETFDLFIDSVEQTENPLLHGVLKALRHFAHQLNYPKDFDYSNVSRLIPEYEQGLPDISDYYGKVIKYCLETKWGKHA